MKGTERRPVAIGERVTLALLLSLLAIVLVHTDWLWRWDRIFYDGQLRLWQRPPPDDIVIVAIDEETLRKFGRWPWSRARHARLLSIISEDQPAAVAFDVIFAEPDLRDPAGDAAFVASVKSNGRVVLPVLMEQPRHAGTPIETLPLPELADVAAALGHVHVELDPDGIVRRLYLYEGLGSPFWPHLSLALLGVAGEPAAIAAKERHSAPFEESPLVWARRKPLLIPFAGPPGHFRRISYGQVMSGDFAPGTFRNKFVLVGLTAAGLGDALPTPVSGFSHSMSGVEINANVLESLRRGYSIAPLGKNLQVVLSGFLALLPILIFPYRTPRTNLLATAGLIVSIVGFSAGFLLLMHRWFPPAPALVAVMLSYPLWSWRRLELAMRYLSQELDRLHEQELEIGYRKQQSLEPVLEFVEQILPVSGYSVFSAEGKQLVKRGEAPGVLPAYLGKDNWTKVEDALWASIEEGEKQYWVGLKWNPSRSPDAQEKTYLNHLLQKSNLMDEAGTEGAERDLQARISQVQLATSRLQELRRFIDDSLANMADAVIVADARGQVLLSNTRAAWYLRGDDSAELKNLPIKELLTDIHLEEGRQWRQLLGKAILEGSRVQASARFRDGRDVLVQVAPLTTYADEMSGVVLNLSDISLLKASERKRTELLNFVSHDLRSPLVSLTALLDLARNEENATELVKLLDRMQSYTDKTLSLAEQFLQLARAESSEGFVFQDVDMITIALNAVEQVWGQAKARHIVITQKFEVDQAWLTGDGGLLERALVNLLDNAIKYGDENSEITLKISIEDLNLYCCVSDKGIGIPSNELPRVFDRFHRVKRATTRESQGAGLGLSFVDVVAKRHGGRIEVESQEGQGSSFCITLPFGTTEKKAG